MYMNEIICDECGKKIKPGNTDGMPNGVGFQLENGKIINICQACIIKAGKETLRKGGKI